MKYVTFLFFLFTFTFSARVVEYNKGKPSDFMEETQFTKLRYYNKDDVKINIIEVDERFSDETTEIYKNSVVYKSLYRDRGSLGVDLFSINAVLVNNNRLEMSDYSLIYNKSRTILSAKTGVTAKKTSLRCNLSSQTLGYQQQPQDKDFRVFERAVSYKSVSFFIDVNNSLHTVYLSDKDLVKENINNTYRSKIPDLQYTNLFIESKEDSGYLYLVSHQNKLILIYSIVDKGKAIFDLTFINSLIFDDYITGVQKLSFDGTYLYLLDAQQSLFYYQKVKDDVKTPVDGVEFVSGFTLSSQFNYILTTDGQEPVQAIDFAVNEGVIYIVSEGRGVFLYDVKSNVKQPWNFNHPYVRQVSFYRNPINGFLFMGVLINNQKVNEYYVEFLKLPGTFPLLNKVHVSETSLNIKSVFQDEFFIYFVSRENKEIVMIRKGLTYLIDELIYLIKLNSDGNVEISSKLTTIYDKTRESIAFVFNGSIKPVIIRNLNIYGEDLGCYFGEEGEVTFEFYSQNEVCESSKTPEIQVCNRKVALNYVVKEAYYANTSGVMVIIVLMAILLIGGGFAYIFFITKCCRKNPLKGMRQAQVFDYSFVEPQNRV